MKSLSQFKQAIAGAGKAISKETYYFRKFLKAFYLSDSYKDDPPGLSLANYFGGYVAAYTWLGTAAFAWIPVLFAIGWSAFTFGPIAAAVTTVVAPIVAAGCVFASGFLSLASIYSLEFASVMLATIPVGLTHMLDRMIYKFVEGLRNTEKKQPTPVEENYKQDIYSYLFEDSSTLTILTTIGKPAVKKILPISLYNSASTKIEKFKSKFFDLKPNLVDEHTSILPDQMALK